MLAKHGRYVRLGVLAALQAALAILAVRGIGTLTAIVRHFTADNFGSTWLGLLVTAIVTALLVIVYCWTMRVERPVSHALTIRGVLRAQCFAVGAATILVCLRIASHVVAQGAIPHISTAPLELISAESLGYAIVVVVIQSAVIEELGFRGYLQTRVHARCGPTWAVLVSAVAYAIAHEYPATAVHTPIWYLAVSGATFALLMLTTRHVWASVSAHALTNATNVILNVGS